MLLKKDILLKESANLVKIPDIMGYSLLIILLNQKVSEHFKFYFCLFN